MNECLQLVFSGLVAMSTVVYALLTWKLVNETRKIREFQITPDINVYFEISETNASFFYIVIENMGLGVALNVNFNIKKDFQNYDDEFYKLSSKGIITKGLKNFYPKQRFRYFFTDLSHNHEKKLTDSINLQVSYEDILKGKYTKQFELILDEISGSSKFNPPDTYVGRIAHELHEIRTTLNKEKNE